MVSDSKCNSSDKPATGGNPQGKGLTFGNGLTDEEGQLKLLPHHTHWKMGEPPYKAALNMQILFLLLASLASVTAQTTAASQAGGASQVTSCEVLLALHGAPEYRPSYPL